METLERFGYSAEVQEFGPAASDSLANVMIRIPGTASTGAVLFATHYDSVPMGPGASDAGVSVAALLETARVLSEAATPRNDLVILLTDGEEQGLVGGRAFVDEHPWAQDVRLVFNFEGRGTSGPPVAFELEKPTVALLSGYLRHAPRPVSSSSVVPVVPESYRRNISDFGEYRRLDIQGIHFALLGKSLYYHTPKDDLAHASPGSLQHVGETAVALARHFGDEDLDVLRESPRATWSTAIPTGGVAAPAWLAWPFLAAAVAVAAAGVHAAVTRRGERIRSLAAGTGVHVLTLLVAGLVGVVLLRLLKTFDDARVLLEELPVRFHRNAGDVVNGAVFAWAFVAVAAAATVVLLSLARRRISDASLVAGGLVLAGIGVVGTTLWDPGTGAVAATVYVISGLAGVLWTREGTLPHTYRSAALLALLAVPVVMTGAALIWFGYLGLTLNNVAVLTAGSAVLAMMLVPQLEFTRRVAPWLAASALIGTAASLLVVGVITQTIDGDLVDFADRTGSFWR